jgi:hypothetical protein
MITHERLKELLRYDCDTGEFFWLKPTSNRVKVGQKAKALSHGYVSIRLDNKTYRGHRLVWLYVYGVMPKNTIDHIDGNTANNKLNNLREATQQQNLFNLKKPITNTSGYKGVHFHKITNKWRAVVSVNNKPKHLGLYKTPEEASIVYNNWCVENRGDFAWLNK